MLDKLADDGFAQASLTKLLSMFATVVTYAEKRDLLHRNVVRLATIPPTAKRSKRRRSLSSDEGRSLLAQLRKERNGAMYGLGLVLGLRPGEASALWWSDVDFDAGTVNVTRGLQRHGGKVVIVDNLKTESTSGRSRCPPTLPIGCATIVGTSASSGWRRADGETSALCSPRRTGRSPTRATTATL